ncbi:MAG TPA: carboxypeptidase-like regulatory domain-containing protein [Planctomycetota bacterium]
MTTAPPSGITMLLRALALLQGVLIVVLTLMLSAADDQAPAHASPAASLPAGAPAEPAAAATSPAHGSATAPQQLAAAASPVQDGAPGTAAVAGEAASASVLTGGAAPAATAGDAVGTVLYGRVLDEAGQPIPEGNVWFSRPGDNKQLASVSLNARDPCYAIAGLAPGEVAYRTRSSGYKEAADTIAIPPGTPRLRHDIVLTKSWEILVRIVTPDGKPVHAALREARKDHPALVHVEVTALASATPPEGDFPPSASREVTAGIGSWRSAQGIQARMRSGKQQPDDVAGVIEVDGKQAVWVSAVLRHRVLASASVEPGQTEITLTVPVDRVLRDLGTIRGRVVDAATREPVTDANVSFDDLQTGSGGAKVDAEGRFEVRDLRPGLLRVGVRAPKRSAPRDLVALSPGQVLDLGDVPLAEFRTIPGRCEGITGKAESCHVSYVSLEPPPHASIRRSTESARVEADGTFKLHMTDGRYRLRASGAGGAIVEIDTRALGDGTIVLKLEKEANLRIDATGSGSFQLAVFEASGRELYRRDLRGGSKLSLSFLVGDYRVEVKNERGKVETRRVTLGDGGADLRVP